MEQVTSQGGARPAEGMGVANQFVVFRLGDNEFAVPIEQVQEILVLGRLTRVPKLPEFIEGIINVRGRIVPVVNLCKRFDIQGRPWDLETRIIVVEVAEQTIGMIVDMVTEVAKIPLTAVEPPPPLITTVSPKFLTGIGKLENRILVILDLERVLSPAELLEVSAPGGVAAASREAEATSMGHR